MAALNRLHASDCSPEQRSGLTAEIRIQGQKLLELINAYRLEPGEVLQQVMRQGRAQPADSGSPAPAQGDE